jgi:DNA topoisomerase-2
MSTKSIRVEHFINSSVKEYSQSNVVRSIPLLFDGLKPSQRKVIHGLLVRGENNKEIKVATLAEHVSGCTDYHHGGGSLVGAIVGLAKTMRATNNMNLLMPNGQFTSILTDEAAAPRYIFTEFSPYFRQLFKKEDDILLEYLTSDDEKIEPRNYFPLLPMSLVNGAEGIGSGHACYILQYHPEHVRDACLKVLAGKRLAMSTLIPWFRGFSGEVTKDDDTGQITTVGRLERVNSTTLHITELPINSYVDDYKSLLYELKDEGFIKDFDDDSSAMGGFKFLITVPRSTTELDDDVLYKRFKLIKRESENFTLWNEQGVLERFETPEEIVERFVPWRITWYEERRQRLIRDLTEDVRFLNEKLRFILFYLKNVDVFRNKKRDDLIEILLKNKFIDYDRLLQQAIWKLTRDEIEKLQNAIKDSEERLKELQADTAIEMYKRELKAFKYDPAIGLPKK